MDRLTYPILRDSENQAYDSKYSRETLLHRLAAYEDTGLTPTDISTLRNELCLKCGRYNAGCTKMCDKYLVEIMQLKEQLAASQRREQAAVEDMYHITATGDVCSMCIAYNMSEKKAKKYCGRCEVSQLQNVGFEWRGRSPYKEEQHGT